MKRFRKSLLFALAVLPAAAVGGYFLGFYILDMYDAATLALIEEQLGSLELLPFVSTTLPDLSVSVSAGAVESPDTSDVSPVAV